MKGHIVCELVSKCTFYITNYSKVSALAIVFYLGFGGVITVLVASLVDMGLSNLVYNY